VAWSVHSSPGVKRRAEWSWSPAFGSAEAVEGCARGGDRHLDSTPCLLHGRWCASRQIGPLSTLGRVRQGPGPWQGPEPWPSRCASLRLKQVKSRRRLVRALLPSIQAVAQSVRQLKIKTSRVVAWSVHSSPGVKRRAEWSWRPAFGSAEAVEGCARGGDRHLDSTPCLLHGRWCASRQIGPLSTLSRVRQGTGPWQGPEPWPNRCAGLK
jgi:hypothetical protein